MALKRFCSACHQWELVCVLRRRSFTYTLVEAIRRLCREVGYFGVFEIEFLRVLDRGWAVIDFNPRFYHQMGFDIARGLPLPIWAYLGASGREVFLFPTCLTRLCQTVRRLHSATGFTLRALLTAMVITGRLNKS